MKITSNELFIAGPCGKIQAVVDLPAENNISSPFKKYVSVSCHPHSLHGGSMTNKVVHTVSRTIASFGIPSIRFNFRSVGKSAGVFDNGKGEQEDLKAVVDWVKTEYPNAKLLLSGFSFGSFVSTFAANNLEPELLISVAPPVKRVSFDGLDRPHCDWKVIMGTEDELVDYVAVKEWVEGFERPPELITMDGASHFFHGRLIELREQVETIVSNFIQGSH